MKKISQNIINNSAYTEFSGENERIISALISTIKTIISEIENSTADHDSKIKELFSSININNAVLSHFKNSEGIELILKLRAVTEKYKTNFEENSRLLDTAEHLLLKLDVFKTNLFKTAEAENISETLPGIENEDHENSDIENLRYKWITFERNNSRFITEFKTIEILDYDSIDEKDADSIYYNNKKIAITDLMTSPDSSFTVPLKIVIIDSGKRIYAADHTGRDIRSSNDIITPIIQPLEYPGNHYSGRVRLFGIRFLVIRHDE